ncbi:MAG: YjhG/YagF family D-xylonate dehydratase, partial [Acidobacteria bacterium]|nr:YjhG/YagF family D-xylonate dehydratase [Acidobacteriota bacterium]
MSSSPLLTILEAEDRSVLDVVSKAKGPEGSLPLTAEMLIQQPSGNIFGWTQNAGMGLDPRLLGGKEILLLSTHGGIRATDGSPVALGYHTGH